MFLAFREKFFVKRRIRRLLRVQAEISAARPDLTGKDLYREVLLHTRQIDETRVDRMLQEAETSVDTWTAPGREKLGFREVVHYFVFSQYLEAGHAGTAISIKAVVDEMVPSNI